MLPEAEQWRRAAKELVRAAKWSKMLARWPAFAAQQPAKLKARARKGVPDAHRGAVWAHLGCAAQLRKEHGAGRWASLCQEAAGVATRAEAAQAAAAAGRKAAGRLDAAQVDALTDVAKKSWHELDTQRMIEKDLPRTFPHHRLYRRRSRGASAAAECDDEDGAHPLEPRGVGRLRAVLRAYACYDRDAGYCQGMSFVAAMLLMYYPATPQGPGADLAAARAATLAVEAAALAKAARASSVTHGLNALPPTPPRRRSSSPRVDAWPTEDLVSPAVSPLKQRDKVFVRADAAAVAAAAAAAELASADEGAETVFWLLVSVLWRPGKGSGSGNSDLRQREWGSGSGLGWRLRECYLPTMEACHANLHVFGQLLHQHVPDVGRHLDREGVVPSMFATSW
jgi:hypothetical protein